MDFTTQMIRVLGALGLITALIFAVVYGLRRFGVAGRLNAGGELIRVVARKPIAPKSQLVLVSVSRKFFLLALSPQGIQSLGEVDEPELATTDTGLSGPVLGSE